MSFYLLTPPVHSGPGPIVPAFLPTSAPVVPVHRQQLGSTGHCHLLGHCSPTPVNIFHSFRFRQNEYSLDINCWLPLCRDWNHPALVGSFHLHKVRMNDEMQDKDQCLYCDYEWSGCGTKCLNQDSSRVWRISWFTTSTSWWPFWSCSSWTPSGRCRSTAARSSSRRPRGWVILMPRCRCTWDSLELRGTSTLLGMTMNVPDIVFSDISLQICSLPLLGYQETSELDLSKCRTSGTIISIVNLWLYTSSLQVALQQKTK